MTLPPISNTMERYQDNGIYLCTASNSVNDSSGNIFQTGKTFVISNGPPVLLEKNEHVQYVNRAKILNLKFSVYSPSDLECFKVDNSKTEIKTSTEMKSVNRTTIFHGVEISVSSIKVVSRFNISDESDQQVYTITLCNAYGNSSFVIELTPIDVDEMKSKRTKIAVSVSSVMLVLCVVISGITIFLKRKRNTRRNARRETEEMTEVAEGFPITLNHAPEKAMRNVKRSEETNYSHVWC
ncbi:uncharacterized protein LOC134694293 [Mytilus trossulus]|uniref:uncharacterized protein LOC134694293 n=1 Tax=Mytilus trossulus TaxID=6551 RepID=UPI00300723A4